MGTVGLSSGPQSRDAMKHKVRKINLMPS